MTRACLFVVAAALIVQNPIPLHACGDKLLLLGRGIRFQSKHTPRAAAVLLYLPLPSGGALADPKLETALREAGHAVRVATTQQELGEAVQSTQYDVILADLAEAPDLRAGVQQSKAIVVPVVYLLAPSRRPESKADAARAEKNFNIVLTVPGRPGHYCALVDKAMEMKQKQNRREAR